MELIDKTVIENILHKLWKEDKGYGYIDTARTSYNKALQKVQCEIDALEVKEVDLEEKACNAYCKVCGHYAHTTPNHICRQACDYYKNFVKYLKGE
jgi:transcription elongation factor Elf1